jgi:hypothetical protein
MARAAGIDVTVISVLNQGTLEVGAQRFYEHFVDDLGITDFQVNTPFPGGADNDVKQSLSLDLAELSRFHCELADIWLERGHEPDVRIGPFDQLMNYFMDRNACLPCIWGEELRRRAHRHRRPRQCCPVRLLGDQPPGLCFREHLRLRQPARASAQQYGAAAVFRTTDQAHAGRLYSVRLPGPVPRRLSSTHLQYASKPV